MERQTARAKERNHGLSECEIFCSSYSSEKGQDSWTQNGETDCQTCTNRDLEVVRKLQGLVYTGRMET